MPIMAKDPGTEFIPAPEGLHQAVAVDVVDLGIVDTGFGKKWKVKIVWQIEARGQDGRRMIASKRYTNSLADKANLRHDLESWRSRKFTPEELRGFDLERLIGANCQVNIVHDTGKDGRVWANVMSVMPLSKGMTKIDPENYVRAEQRQESNGDTASDDDDESVPF